MLNFDKKLFIYLCIGFIAATVIGTLSHECGHYLVAKYFGYDAEINHAQTFYGDAIVSPENHFWIRIGGIAETILTGTFGLILLICFRKSFYKTERLSFVQWILIFIALFWLRETVNFLVWLCRYVFSGKYSTLGDEIQLAKYLRIPDWTVISVTASIGAVVLTSVIFKFIPKKQRFTFNVSALAGGISGYLLWLVLLGKYIMP